MFVLPGYDVKETIYEKLKTTIYRGIDEQKKQPVLIKIIKTEYPNLEEITGFKQEYQITHNLNCQGVLKAYKLENYKNNLALILEDFGGQLLFQLLQTNQPSIAEFLRMAISLTQTLVQLHSLLITHKDIKPDNILINLKGRVKLTGFNSAITLPKEQQTINSSNLIEGSLTYILPEQTGRMNRSLDYRTDFYSLGITFYEMLTGVVPFPSSDPMELVYYHLAKRPVPPEEKSKIPPAVSQNEESELSIARELWSALQSGSILLLLQAIQDGLEVGDIEFACHAAYFYCAYLFFNGDNLEYVQDKQKQYIKFIQNFRQKHQLYLAKIDGQLVDNLRERSLDKLVLTGEYLNEKQPIAYLPTNNELIYLFGLYFAKCMFYYLLKNNEISLIAKLGAKYLGYV